MEISADRGRPQGGGREGRDVVKKKKKNNNTITLFFFYQSKGFRSNVGQLSRL